MKLGSFNVENLFDRPRIFSDEPEVAEVERVLAAHHELGELLVRPAYDQAAKDRIAVLVEALGLRRSDDGLYVRLHVVRGRLLKRPSDPRLPVVVVADGPGDWVGWIELERKELDVLAMKHTAMVIRDVDADVLGVVEAESRPVLDRFTDAMLRQVGGRPYAQVMCVDGNDTRGIDVGLLSRHPITTYRPHVYDADRTGRVFSRDCAEYHVDVDGQTVVVLVNHFKSKGYSEPGDPQGGKKRRRQAVRVAAIYDGLLAEGLDHVVVVGDLNDTPASTPLKPLMATSLRDITTHPTFTHDQRDGTYGSMKDQIDYVLLSPAMYAKVTGGGIFRKGVWRGPRAEFRWDVYDSLHNPVEAASDHAAIWAEVAL